MPKVAMAVVPALLLTPRRADEWVSPPALAVQPTIAALEAILDPAPEFVLLGTGTTLAHPPRALVAALDAREFRHRDDGQPRRRPRLGRPARRGPPDRRGDASQANGISAGSRAERVEALCRRGDGSLR
ncbi:Mth938-like domain-containing protein [Sphingomonas sp. MMS24-JH45]